MGDLHALGATNVDDSEAEPSTDNVQVVPTDGPEASMRQSF